MHCVTRLRKTWKNLPSKYQIMWKELTRIMSPRQNYLVYRSHLRMVLPPALPYIGARARTDRPSISVLMAITLAGSFLSDLTIIQEKYPTKIGNGLINLNKMRMLAAVIADIQQYQTTSNFPFTDNPPLRRYLKYDAQAMDDDALYDASKAAEAGGESSGASSPTVASPDAKSSPQQGSFMRSIGRRTFRGTFRTMKGLSDFEKYSDK